MNCRERLHLEKRMSRQKEHVTLFRFLKEFPLPFPPASLELSPAPALSVPCRYPVGAAWRCRHGAKAHISAQPRPGSAHRTLFRSMSAAQSYRVPLQCRYTDRFPAFPWTGVWILKPGCVARGVSASCRLCGGWLYVTWRVLWC